MRLLNKNANEPYYYNAYWINDIESFNCITKLKDYEKRVVGRGKNSKRYCELYACFDIETYTTESNNGYMYIWQFGITNDINNMFVIRGRTWNEFSGLLKYLEFELNLNSKNRLIIFIANLSYEFQFMRKHLNVTDYFFKEKYKPLKIVHNDCIEFLDILPVSGGNLDYVAKTYCNTQKCVGDLDYSIPRNRLTKLNELELSYCDNDVLIGCEWSHYYFETYIKGGCGYKSAPLTIQSTIRHDLKIGAKKWFIETGGNAKNVNLAISSCFPSEETYHYLMKWCFRGGYTHGNIAHVDELLINKEIVSFDFTSAYPAVMEHCYYPSRFYKKKNIDYDQYLELIKTKCVIATIKLKGVRPTTQHSIESKSKCITLVNPIIDNGRVRFADEMTVCITELDFRIYCKFYEWDSIEIINCLVANRIKLPNYVLEPMEKAYTDKAKLKKQGLKYDVPKSICNSFYGVMVTRQNLENVTYSENEYGIESNLCYDELIKKQVLLPQWGIYTSSHNRYNLLSMVKIIGNDCLYCDTDSIKCMNAFNYLDMFKMYNKRIEKMNKKICKERGLDYSIFWDLGMFDFEGKLFYLKYLGAKRYIYTTIKNGKLKDVQTIAGLPKNILIERSKNRNELYDSFKNEMEVTNTGKLYSYYNDDYSEEYITDNQGNTILQKEESNIGLVPCDFNMTLDENWLEYFIEYQNNLKGKEVR